MTLFYIVYAPFMYYYIPIERQSYLTVFIFLIFFKITVSRDLATDPQRYIPRYNVIRQTDSMRNMTSE